MNTADSPLRLPEVLAIIPESLARWYEGMKSGRFPAQVKLCPHIAAQRRSDVDHLLASFTSGDAA